MISSIQNYFNNSETPIICYKYKKNRSTIYNFNKIVTNTNIDSNTPDSWDCQNSNYLYPSAGHMTTGHLIVISDARVRNIISYRFPSNIDFPKCRREIAGSLNDLMIVGANRKMLNLMPWRNGRLTFLKLLIFVFHLTLVILISTP